MLLDSKDYRAVFQSPTRDLSSHSPSQKEPPPEAGLEEHLREASHFLYCNMFHIKTKTIFPPFRAHRGMREAELTETTAAPLVWALTLFTRMLYEVLQDGSDPFP
jgi:hypothetical protein